MDTGEGLSGLIPGLLGLAQGVGGDAICVNTSLNDNDTEYGLIPEYPPARFSVEVFFFCLFLLICISGIAFTLLHFAPFSQPEKLKNTYQMSTASTSDDLQTMDGENIKVTQFVDSQPSYNSFSSSKEKSTMAPLSADNGVSSFQNGGFTLEDTKLNGAVKTICYQTSQSTVSDVEISDTAEKSQSSSLSKAEFVLLLVYLAFVNSLTNGVMPSILSYSCLPYSKSAWILYYFTSG